MRGNLANRRLCQIRQKKMPEKLPKNGRKMVFDPNLNINGSFILLKMAKNDEKHIFIVENGKISHF